VVVEVIVTQVRENCDAKPQSIDPMLHKRVARDFQRNQRISNAGVKALF
jgi:hypothetical protein